MGRAPCCSKVGLHRGPWTPREDTLLIQYIQSHGEGHWKSLPKNAGLLRCGKSCRLRWMNYLRPDIKRGNITPDEEDLIVRLHTLLGNRWSLIAGRLPGRTDNEIKNYWNTHLSKRLKNQKTNKNGASRCVEPKKYESNDQNAAGGAEEVAGKIKVHLSKPVRVSQSLIPIGGGNHKQEAACHDSEVSNLDHVSWSDEINKDDHDFREALVCENVKNCDVFHESIEGCDPACQNSEVNAERVAMPRKIYEEFQQLLKSEDHVQLESFVDSLLI